MSKQICEHPLCNNSAHIGLCRGHRSLIADDNYWVGICKNCGKLVRVMLKPSPTEQKYVWSQRCRSCGGTVKDEEQLLKEY